MKTDYIECVCHSNEHSIRFMYDEEYNEIYVHVFLGSYKNIFKRLWLGIIYIFGYTSKYGFYNETILSIEHKQQVLDIISQLKNKE